MKWLRHPGVLLLVVAAALAGGAVVIVPALRGSSGDTADRASGPPAATAVTVAAVTARPVVRRVAVVGTLEGHEEVNLAPKVDGRVLRIHHDVGDVVAPGQALLELDDTDYRLAVSEAQRGLELELARLGLKDWPGNGQVDVRRVPALVRARNLEENARQVLDRARRLGAARVLATEEVEKLQTEYRVAHANREAAELEAHTTLAAARQKLAQLDTARQKLADARLCAPCPSPGRLPAGVSDPRSVRYVVALRKLAEGELVRSTPPTVAFRLVIDNPLKLVATVPEGFVGEVRLGQPVELHVEAYPSETFHGTLTRLNPTIDRVNRTFTVEVTVPNADRRLRAGGFVKASIRTRANDRALTVPEEAVIRFAGVVKVFVVHDGSVRAVPVETGEAVTVQAAGREQRWVEVSGGLTAGARVVSSGHAQLADGSRVRVR